MKPHTCQRRLFFFGSSSLLFAPSVAEAAGVGGSALQISAGIDSLLSTFSGPVALALMALGLIGFVFSIFFARSEWQGVLGTVCMMALMAGLLGQARNAVSTFVGGTTAVELRSSQDFSTLESSEAELEVRGAP